MVDVPRFWQNDAGDNGSVTSQRRVAHMNADLDLNISRRQMLKLGSAVVAFAGLAGCARASEANTDVTGIIGAMENEVAAIKASMDDAQTTTMAGTDYISGTIGGTPVAVVQSGVGKVNAGICAQTLISVFGAVRVINTGVAGSLTDELTINDFVVSTDAVQHDFDVSAIGFKKGEIPYTGLVAFPADEALRQQAVEAVREAAPSSKVLEGRVCSGDQFVSTQEQVDAITSEFGGLCAEMEGAAIAQVCYLNKTPYVIIRCISDESDSMSYEEFQEAAAAECANAVLTMVKSL